MVLVPSQKLFGLAAGDPLTKGCTESVVVEVRVQPCDSVAVTVNVCVTKELTFGLSIFGLENPPGVHVWVLGTNPLGVTATFRLAESAGQTRVGDTEAVILN